MNETPEFMKACLHGARRSWRMEWIVANAAKKCGVHDSAILDRPKTPHGYERYTTDACTWLARWFNPVFLALADGKSDDEIIRLWINIDRSKTPAIKGRIDSKEWTQINRYRRETRTTRYIKARELSKKHDWATVK